MRKEAPPEVPPAFKAPRSVTPRVPEWQENLARGVAVIALLYATHWIVWRWGYTMNTDPRAIVPSVLLLLAETYAWLNMCLFVFMVWRLRDRDPGLPPAGRTVDVFITCYDEPIEVLRRTAIGAREIIYPHRTYMLDDGKRDEVRAMAESLGIGYIRRVGNANAKSGNLNFALSVTSGEFILQLDADHVPLPHIIHRLLGYFNDPDVALVQSPQDFYNVDSFSHIVNDEGRRLWEENRIFYSLIQPGRDNWGAAFFCGSGGVLRRAALDDIGGFATKTIIEDMETTMELNARGWKSLYHNETLAYGLAPGNAGAYHVQRLRWGQGAMQVLRKMKPLTMKGLTLAQRINYFAGTATYMEGWQKAIFYLMPLFYFFTGILPVDVNETEFISRLVPYLMLSILTFELLSRGTGYLLLSERFTMVRFFTYMVAVLSLFSTKPLKFNVTPKGKGGVPFRTYAPQLTLLILSVAAPIFATIAYYRGWIDYGAPGWNSLAFTVNGLWIVWNCYFAAHVVRHSMAMKTQRDDHRFAELIPIQVRTDTDNSETFPALTTDLNSSGVGLRSTHRLPPGTQIEIDLPLATGTIAARGAVRHVVESRTTYGSVFNHGVVFHDLSADARDRIELHCTQHAMPAWRQRYRQSVDIVTRVGELTRSTRRDRRRLVGLPAHVRRLEARDDDAAAEVLVLQEISARGARLMGETPIDPETMIHFSVPGAHIDEHAIVRYVSAVRTSVAIQFEMGVELVRPDQPGTTPVQPDVPEPADMTAGQSSSPDEDARRVIG